MSSLGADLGLPQNARRYQPSNELVLPACCIGVEFEFENVTEIPIEPWYGVWQHKHDGSLRGRGLEYVFREPLFGQDAVTAVRNLCNHARTKGHAVSQRTGLHVHVDVRDMNMEALKRMCAFYALFEKAIYRYVGDNRHENVFCLPWFSAHGTINMVKRALQSPDSAHFRDRVRTFREQRYAGLNLDSLPRFGSVEFRHMLSTTDASRVLNWINICLRLKEAAIRDQDNLSSKQLLSTVSTLGPDRFARSVLGLQYDLLCRYPEFESELWEFGVPMAVDILELEDIKPKEWNAKATPHSAQFKAWALAHPVPKKRNKDAQAADYQLIMDDPAAGQLDQPELIGFGVAPGPDGPFQVDMGMVDPGDTLARMERLRRNLFEVQAADMIRNAAPGNPPPIRRPTRIPRR